MEALENGTITSAALDVFEVEPVPANSPLIQHENFHGTPHIGAATLEAQHRVGIDIARRKLSQHSREKSQQLWLTQNSFDYDLSSRVKYTRVISIANRTTITPHPPKHRNLQLH